MSEFDQMQNEAITRAIENQLAKQPHVAVPADFAARVRASLPSVRPARSRGSVGRVFAFAALAASAVAMFSLAPHAAPSFNSLQFDLEMMLLAEMAAIGWWMGVRRSARGHS